MPNIHVNLTDLGLLYSSSFPENDLNFGRDSFPEKFNIFIYYSKQQQAPLLQRDRATRCTS